MLASNTSGLSINALAEVLPAALRNRFCGVHFFNPPRYMHLVELIPRGDHRRRGARRALETFLVTTLGKGVGRAKDTPNFIGNRVGVFSMLATMHHAQRLGSASTRSMRSPARAIGRRSRDVSARATWSASTPWRTW